MINNYTHKTLNLNTTYTNRFGGYIAYWKLLFIMIYNIFNNTLISKGQKFLLIYDLLIWKSWFYLLIKPLGCIFNEKIYYNGTIETNIERPQHYEELQIKVRKIYTMWIFRYIPIFGYISKPFTNFDKNYLFTKMK